MRATAKVTPGSHPAYFPQVKQGCSTTPALRQGKAARSPHSRRPGAGGREHQGRVSKIRFHAKQVVGGENDRRGD